MLKNAPAVALHEAAASGSPENEMKVQKAIEKLLAGRTVIAIAHRLKIVKNDGHIVVLEDERAVEQGTDENRTDQDGLCRKPRTIQAESSGWAL